MSIEIQEEVDEEMYLQEDDGSAQFITPGDRLVMQQLSKLLAQETDSEESSEGSENSDSESESDTEPVAKPKRTAPTKKPIAKGGKKPVKKPTTVKQRTTAKKPAAVKKTSKKEEPKHRPRLIMKIPVSKLKPVAEPEVAAKKPKGMSTKDMAAQLLDKLSRIGAAPAVPATSEQQ